MAARDFRYDWFRKIAKEQGYTQIATAHHLNDNLETLIFNQTKGCGLNGLQGIPLKNGNVIRPLLFADRQQIEAYALAYQLTWREDASNALIKYHRNLIRHEVIPALKKINPSVEATTANNLRRWQESYQIYQRMVLQLKAQLVQENQGIISIDAKILSTYPERSTLLYEWLSPFGFTEATIRDLISEERSGRQFLSNSHRLVTHQDVYLVDRLKTQDNEKITIQSDQKEIELGDGQTLQLRYLSTPPTFYPKDVNIAYLSERQLDFPLILRHWQTGDRFQPLGMKGQHQKLQDYFSNQKISLVEKEKVWLLTSSEQICWVVGMRVDERFKVKNNEGCWEVKLVSK